MPVRVRLPAPEIPNAKAIGIFNYSFKEDCVVKVKHIILVLIFSLVCILCGCGKNQPTESQPSTEPQNPTEQAILCYQEILNAAPAIEGKHTELEDASFDYEQNFELFGDHFDQFALIDLNGDNIPELLASSVINFRWVPVSVFTYADGNAVLLDDPTGEATHGTFEQCSTAGGNYTTFICEDNHIHSMWSGDTPIGWVEENYAYIMEGTNLAAVDCQLSEGTFFADIAESNTPQNIAAIRIL